VPWSRELRGFESRRRLMGLIVLPKVDDPATGRRGLLTRSMDTRPGLMGERDSRERPAFARFGVAGNFIA